MSFGRYGMRGFGAFAGTAVVFDAASVWSDQVAGANGDNAAGTRWGKTMQAALNEVGGYGLPLTGFWGSKSQAAWKDFCSKHGMTALPNGYPSGQGQLDVLQQALAAKNPSGTTGAGTELKTVTQTSGGTVEVKLGPDGKPVEPGGGETPTKSALSTPVMVGIAVASVAVIGLLAVAAKKRPSAAYGGAPSYAANRRRRKMPASVKAMLAKRKRRHHHDDDGDDD